MPEDAVAAYTEPAPLALVQVSRTFPAPRERVFRAWTDAEIVKRWFGIRGTIVDSVESDVRPGGHYRITVKVPPTMRRIHVSGTFLEVEPPARIVYTFGWENLPITRGMGESKVTVAFRELDGSTEVHLTHELLDKARVRAWHSLGWKGSFKRLARVL
jgi:uncharacterized protein YndB with AHSA1/START domain